MTNPKFREEICNEKRMPEDSDYPRWTPSMREILARIGDFREELRRMRP
jgi:hypothetical protein